MDEVELLLSVTISSLVLSGLTYLLLGPIFALYSFQMSMTFAVFFFGPLLVHSKVIVVLLALLAVGHTASGDCSFGWWREPLGVRRAWSAGIEGQGVRVMLVDTGASNEVLKEVFGRGYDECIPASYIVHKDECASVKEFRGHKLCLLYKLNQLEGGGWDEHYYAVPLDCWDWVGHGTAVSAAILSVAPKVTLIEANVAGLVVEVNEKGEVVKIPYLAIDPGALAYALERGKADVVNMSLGTNPWIPTAYDYGGASRRSDRLLVHKGSPQRELDGLRCLRRERAGRSPLRSLRFQRGHWGFSLSLHLSGLRGGALLEPLLRSRLRVHRLWPLLAGAQGLDDRRNDQRQVFEGNQQH